jgi:hypothetical protein
MEFIGICFTIQGVFVGSGVAVVAGLAAVAGVALGLKSWLSARKNNEPPQQHCEACPTAKIARDSS